MPTYIVDGYLTISVTAEINAENNKEARKKAKNLTPPNLCHQCDGGGDNNAGEWTLNGWDEPPDDCIHDVRKVLTEWWTEKE